MNKRWIDRLKGLFEGLAGKGRFGKFDSALLKTMVMLSAVDGEISPSEIANLRDMAEKCSGYSGETFESLWDAALHSAGYLFLQTRFLAADALAKAFVSEAEKDFVSEVALEDSALRERAFDALEKMASADGDYSAVEAACIEALAERVRAFRNQAIAERYPRAAIFDK